MQRKFQKYLLAGKKEHFNEQKKLVIDNLATFFGEVAKFIKRERRAMNKFPSIVSSSQFSVLKGLWLSVLTFLQCLNFSNY